MTLTIECETCAYKKIKNQTIFRCMSCGKTMHITSKCTKMSEQIIAALQEENVSIFFLCNQCVSLNKRNIFIEAAKNHQNKKPELKIKKFSQVWSPKQLRGK